jgi:hypothetical protein
VITTGEWFGSAFSHRAEVHQATGMVLAQLGISAEDALVRLRAHALVHQRLLIDVARDVICDDYDVIDLLDKLVAHSVDLMGERPGSSSATLSGDCGWRPRPARPPG